MLKPWWERFPGRLEYEFEGLREIGVEFQQDEIAFRNGRLELDLRAVLDEKEIKLHARFPDLYPYFRFELFAPELTLPHHQNPFLKNLCLIGSATEKWHTGDTLAAFIRDRLPVVLRTGAAQTSSEVIGLEEVQAEPITAYYRYGADSIILVESSWVIDPAVSRGRFLLGIESHSTPVIRGAIQEILDDRDKSVAQESRPLSRLYKGSLRGRWVRIAKPVFEEDAARFLEVVSREHPDLRNPRWHWFGDYGIDVVGVLFPEEAAWRKTGQGWLFVVRVAQNRRGFRPGHFWKAYFARPAPVGADDMFTRVPELGPLRGKKIALVGLGCVGAPSALEFARSGLGRLNIMDGDIVEPGTTVRWPVGIRAAGRSKAKVLEEVIRSDYPYTDVASWHHRLGSALGDQEPDLKVLNDFLTDADLIFDASAELGVTHVLADFAREQAVPFVSISSTPGGWGGRATRIVPSRTKGCWMCLQHAVLDGRIPAPPFSPVEPVQPTGCTAPTFTGASFDVQEISLAGVRLAISTLCAGDASAYPDVDWDVAVLTIRDQVGLKTPSWKTYTLERHPQCELCRAMASHG